MSAVIQASGLGRAYRRTWALRDYTLAIPEGRVIGLVGPNGAGKTTLLRLAAGLLAPTCGTISVLGEEPTAGPTQLARVGFVAQDTPVYARMTVADHLRLGTWLNTAWDDEMARRRIGQLGLEPRQRAGVPLARREFLRGCASLAISFVNKLAGFYAVFYFIPGAVAAGPVAHDVAGVVFIRAAHHRGRCR